MCRFAIIHASWNSRKTACELFGISPLSPCMTVLLSDDIFSQNRSTLIISVDMKEHSESALGLAMFFGTT